MDKQEIKVIIQKYLDGTASAEERAQLQEWYNHYAVTKPRQDFPMDIWFRQQSTLEAILGKPAVEIDNVANQSQGNKIPLWRYIGIAAAVVAIVFGVWLFYTSRYNEAGQRGIKYANDIAPGKAGATLTLANGRKISLSAAVNGILAKESGVLISKDSNGDLQYEIQQLPQSPEKDASSFNTLSTANGETYQVKLPDGTRIWLNSASALKYPSSFASLRSRNIELTGEAYFEVAKDKRRPFIVKTDQQQVKVWGTHFNISSYVDDDTKTTLLEGSVSVLIGSKPRFLKPGEQSVLKDGTIKIAEVDTDEAIAWKNGYFNFNHEALESIMNKISRWYDVKIEYENQELKAQVFSGTISRFKSVSLVLDKLELTNAVTFKISGKKITVKSKVPKRI